MSEGKVVPMQIQHRVVADTIRPVRNRFHHFNALDAVKLVQLIGITQQDLEKGKEERSVR